MAARQQTPRGMFGMDKVRISLKNCYGIKSLDKDFDFAKGRGYAIYAPNGVMKSSLAQTFQDAAAGSKSSDRIFPQRKTIRLLLDESKKEIGAEHILVVLPYDKQFGITEKTSTLLIDPKLRRQYEDLIRATDQARDALISAIRKQSKSKKDFRIEVASAFASDTVDTALARIERELKDQRDAPFANVEYDTIFNDKVATGLNLEGVKAAIEDYVRVYNDLLSKSTYFKKGFDYYNAGEIAKSLTSHGFFSAKHAVSLKATAGNKEINTQQELEDVITQEKTAILSDPALRKKFNTIEKQLNKNIELRAFCKYLQENAALLARMNNPEMLRQDVLKSYIKTNHQLYEDWLLKFDAAAKRRKELEQEALGQRTQWERVIEIFNERFTVPFKLETKNKAEVMLSNAIIDLGFTYTDGADSASVEKDALLTALSTGERKALYVLNVIFEIETRKKNGTETLLVVDDLADSFDYQNKYAIIHYLKEVSEDGLFKLLLMTHNFDFFRTIQSRFVDYSQCLMATKTDNGITLAPATGIKNVFALDWKKGFFKDQKKKIACIPFLRNLIEMTVGEDDKNFKTLTAMLHWRPGVSEGLTVQHLDAIFNEICEEKGTSASDSQPILELVMQEANSCLSAVVGANFENKIVLAIGIRLVAERFMISKIADDAFVQAIHATQTQILVTKFKSLFPSEEAAVKILDRVALMTPEHIHINSFMYEPIVDMSDEHLRRLFRDVVELA